MSIKITCYGPRGSLPSPSRKGFSTLEYGGNTSCYAVEAGPFNIILACGSGLSVLGDDLMKQGKIGVELLVFISHYHMDHLAGIGFFVPAYIPSNTLHFHGHQPISRQTPYLQDSVETMLSEQQATPFFPVSHGAMPAKKTYKTYSAQFSSTIYYVAFTGAEGQMTYGAVTLAQYSTANTRGRIKIVAFGLNHPDGCLGFRIEYMGVVVVYCTDNEPFLFPNKEIVKHAQGADWLLLDGQYTVAQLSGMAQGFGHGTPRNCVDQAVACQAKHCVISHLDPRHDDAKVAEMELDAIQYAKEIEYTGAVEFAREGTVWEV